MILEIILAGLVLSLATGGSLKALQHEALRGEAVLLVLLSVQVAWPAVSERLGLACAAGMIIWLALMLALTAVLALNAGKRLILVVAALGIAANILVIALNGAMPVSIRAASEIGGTRIAARAVLAESCLHEELNVDTHLPFLADVIPVPGPTWQRSVISIGDVLLGLGLGGWLFVSTRRSVA